MRLRKLIRNIFLVMIILMIVGCSRSSDLAKVYSNMQMDKISGYSIKIMIYGEYNNSNIKENINISNYKDKEYVVSLDGVSYYTDGRKNYKKEVERFQHSFDVKWEEYDKDILFKDTDKYIKILDKVKIQDSSMVVINNQNYKLYTFEVSKKDAINILDDTSLNNAKVDDIVYGKIWIDEQNYPYHIEYDFTSAIKNSNNLKMDIYFNSINNITSFEEMLDYDEE